MQHEIKRVEQLLAAMQHGDCWIGTNFKETLKGITAEQALHQHTAQQNSIWQVISHLIYWRTVVTSRLQGSTALPPFADMRLPEATDGTAWKQTLLDFEAAYHALRTAILHLKEADLEKPSVRPEQTIYQLLHGCLQHDAYHLGQLVLLKKQT